MEKFDKYLEAAQGGIGSELKHALRNYSQEKLAALVRKYKIIPTGKEDSLSDFGMDELRDLIVSKLPDSAKKKMLATLKTEADSFGEKK
jgi:hypothetical protein